MQTWIIRDGRVFTVNYTYAAAVVDERPRNLLPYFLDSFDLVNSNSPDNAVRCTDARAAGSLVHAHARRPAPRRTPTRCCTRTSCGASACSSARACGSRRRRCPITLGRKGANGNITVTAQRAAKNNTQSLDEQVRGVEKQLGTTVPSYEKEAITDAHIAGMAAKQILYSGSADNMVIKFKQLFFVAHDILYFVCVADAQATFAQSVREAQSVVDTFTVK